MTNLIHSSKELTTFPGQTVTSRANFVAEYRTKGDFSVVTFSAGSGIHLAISTGWCDKVTAHLETTELNQLKTLIQNNPKWESRNRLRPADSKSEVRYSANAWQTPFTYTWISLFRVRDIKPGTWANFELIRGFQAVPRLWHSYLSQA